MLNVYIYYTSGSTVRPRLSRPQLSVSLIIRQEDFQHCIAAHVQNLQLLVLAIALD